VTEYKLYLESGPKMKTTMVHVFDLLGCIANGPTTEEALDATPDAIRRFLALLKRKGEKVDPDAKFTTSIADHVTEGSWIGQGNPDPGFKPDFEPLSRKELAVHVHRLGWLGEELAGIAAKLSKKELAARPAKGRALGDILAHVISAEAEYVRVAGLDKTEGMKALAKETDARSNDPAWLADGLQRMFQGAVAQFRSATDEQLRQQTQRGKLVYTTKRGLRRALEHPWEHLREIERRMERRAT
jgi:predicted RNase H-like HicB family nuclease